MIGRHQNIDINEWPRIEAYSKEFELRKHVESIRLYKITIKSMIEKETPRIQNLWTNKTNVPSVYDSEDKKESKQTAWHLSWSHTTTILLPTVLPSKLRIN